MMELKPCPFCGTAAREIKIGKKYPAQHGVGCSNVECIIFLPGDVYVSEMSNYVWMWVNRDVMVKAWNRRKGDG